MRLLVFLTLILSLLLVRIFLSGAQEVPVLSCSLSVTVLNPGESAELFVDLNRLDEVDSLTLTMIYDPDLIQVQDRIPEQSDTINLALGELLIGNAEITSSVDSASGRIDLTIERTTGDLLAASSGTVAVAGVTALSRGGLTTFLFQEATLTTFNGTTLPLGRVQDCWLDVGNSGQATPTPTTVGKSPLATVTASPTSNSPLPTLTPTPTPTIPQAPSATPTPFSTATPTFTPSLTFTPTPTEVGVDVAQSPLETATPTETPFPIATDTPTIEATSTPTPEPTATETPTPSETPLPLPSATPTPTLTPTLANATPNATLTPALIIVTPFRPTPTPEPIDVIVPRPPSDIEFIVQPDAPESLTRRPPFRLFGFLALAGAILLTALGLVIRRSDV